MKKLRILFLFLCISPIAAVESFRQELLYHQQLLQWDRQGVFNFSPQDWANWDLLQKLNEKYPEREIWPQNQIAAPANAVHIHHSSNFNSPLFSHTPAFQEPASTKQTTHRYNLRSMSNQNTTPTHKPLIQGAYAVPLSKKTPSIASLLPEIVPFLAINITSEYTKTESEFHLTCAPHGKESIEKKAQRSPMVAIMNILKYYDPNSLTAHEMLNLPLCDSFTILLTKKEQQEYLKKCMYILFHSPDNKVGIKKSSSIEDRDWKERYENIYKKIYPHGPTKQTKEKVQEVLQKRSYEKKSGKEEISL